MNPLALIDKYYPEDNELKHILLVHSRSVADKALALAKKHPELNLDLQFIEEAAMLHDIGIFRPMPKVSVALEVSLYLSWLLGSRTCSSGRVSETCISLRTSHRCRIILAGYHTSGLACSSQRNDACQSGGTNHLFC